ncbi:MAG: ribonuclease III [Bacteroidota bacterium]
MASPFKFISVNFSADKKLYLSLKNILGFYPGNISLYKQAFRHSSVASEIKRGVKDSNERLEFLGDAILGAVIAEHLFRMFPYKDEGFLTKMRSRIVSRSSLNQLASRLGIDKFIEASLESSSKSSAMKGDAFEAMLGAIYLDKGYDTTRRFILERIVRNHIDMHEVENKETDFKSKLIEWAQKEKKEVRFILVEEIGDGQEKQFVMEVNVQGEPLGRAQHFSKKRAEQIAAEQACSFIDFDS